MTATLESVKKAIGKKSSSLAFAWLADLERKSGKPDVALDTVNTGLTFLYDYLPGLLVRSAIYFDLERFDDVIESCEAIVKKDPFCIAAWRRLGAAYHKKNQIGKRNHCYRMVHDMDPLDPFWKEEYIFVPPEDIVHDDSFSVADATEFSFTPDLQEDSFQLPVENTSERVVETLEESIPPNMASTPPNLENEDPFSLLMDLLPSDDEKMEDTSLESLESSLDNVMGVISDKDEALPEFFGGDDISENDVSSAFSSMFGMDDELPSEKTVSPFASFEIPTSIDDEEDLSEHRAEEIAPVEAPKPAPVEEDKPQSLSSAFDDIFGEDELPEETPSLDESKGSTIENGFESTFESSFEQSDEPKATTSESTFEKSDDLSTEETSVLKTDIKTPIKEAEEFKSAVDSSLSALFGEDELDLPQDKKTDSMDESSIKNTLENSFSALFGEEDDLELPSKETKNDGALLHSIEEDISQSFDSLFGNDDETLNLSEDKKEPPVLSIDESESTLHPVDIDDEVSGAFASLFSSHEDDLPEEKPQERNGVDFLMSGDSDDEMAVALMNNPSGSLDQDDVVLDENLNTKTLAEIYYEQGLYTKALNIYQDLLKKNPSDQDLLKRLGDIQRQVNEKYGDA